MLKAPNFLYWKLSGSGFHFVVCSFYIRSLNVFAEKEYYVCISVKFGEEGMIYWMGTLYGCWKWENADAIVFTGLNSNHPKRLSYLEVIFRLYICYFCLNSLVYLHFGFDTDKGMIVCIDREIKMHIKGFY